MDLLIVTAASVKGTTRSDVDVEVKVNGEVAPLDPLGGVLLPEARPLRVEVKLTPRGAHLFGVSGLFGYFGEGKLVPMDDFAKAPHFQPVRAATIEGGASVMSLIGYVSRVRDVTPRAVDIINNAADKRSDDPPVTSDFKLQPISHVSTLGNPPLSGQSLIFDGAEKIDPDADVFVLEVAVDPAPKLLAVTCPRRLIPDVVSGQSPESVPAPPVLLYFHSTAGQNFPDFYGGAYPFSWDFIQYGLAKYLFHLADREPLELWGGKGMPYQMARAKRDAVYVLPLNRPFSEVGVMIDAAGAQEILEEVTAFLHRRKGLFVEPGIGRLGLAGFSSGNLLVTRFLQKNAGKPLLNDLLKEVYNFDIPASKMPDFMRAARNWLGSGDASTKMLRIYTQQNHPNEFAQLLGRPAPVPPFFQADATGNRSVLCAPGPTWFEVSSGMAGPNDFQAVHQLIAETCLIDAMRRSGFPRSS